MSRSAKSTPRGFRHFPVVGALLVGAACVSSTEGEISGVAGEWCTLRGLESSGFPSVSKPYVGVVLLQEGSAVFGAGSSKRAGEDTTWETRYRGDFDGDLLTLAASDLTDTLSVPGPSFTLRLRPEGVRDLVGTASGDLAGPITLVRLGPRCFVE